METDTEDRPVPWWQRELNARLARRALRREALRRTALRGLGGAALVALGLLLVLVLAQGTRVRLAGGARRTHRGTALAAAVASPTPTGIATATATIGALRARGATLTLDPPSARGAATHQGADAAGHAHGSQRRAAARHHHLADHRRARCPTAARRPPTPAGVARFRYGGTAPYTVHITATADGQGLARSTVRVAPEPAVATTAVTGRFYASDDRCTFDTPPGTAPVLRGPLPHHQLRGPALHRTTARRQASPDGARRST